jgi:hypothetical protein
MVPTLPVTPGPAAAGPLTGGQYVAHEPLQFDLDAVSGPNQYTVKPFASVSTFAPPIVAVFSAVLDAAAAGLEAALDELLPGLLVLAGDEVPHAAAIRATPARPAGAHHRIRIT